MYKSYILIEPTGILLDGRLGRDVGDPPGAAGGGGQLDGQVVVLDLVVGGGQPGRWGCLGRGLARRRRRGRRFDEPVRPADLAVLAHRRRALAAAEEIRDQEVAVGVAVPEVAVGVAVADLVQLGRWGGPKLRIREGNYPRRCECQEKIRISRLTFLLEADLT